MSKWLKNILAIAILAFLFWYLAGHWENLKAILKLSPKQLVMMYLLCLLPTLITARAIQHLIKALKIRTGYWDMAVLHNASILLNYAPMKFGTVFRANYLKRHYGLAYAHFATFFLYITFLITATAAIIGLAALIAFYGLSGYENKILASFFAAAIIASLLLMFAPLPVPTGQGRLSSTMRNFLSSRSQIARERKTILITSALLVVNFTLTATRLWIAYNSIGRNLHIGGCLILGTLGYVILFVALTPGSLGIRELALGFSAVVVGMPLEVGILAAMIDRAVVISYAFVVGGGCAIWLWHKQPADFKEPQPQ